MPRGNVRNLVRHHTGQFSLVIGCRNYAGVHEKEATRQRERVNLFRVDHLNCERNLRIGIAHQILANAIDIFRNDRIVDDLRLALHFLRHLFADADFFFDRVEVQAFADIAIADLHRDRFFLSAASAGATNAGEKERRGQQQCHNAHQRRPLPAGSRLKKYIRPENESHNKGRLLLSPSIPRPRHPEGRACLHYVTGVPQVSQAAALNHTRTHTLPKCAPLSR